VSPGDPDDTPVELTPESVAMLLAERGDLAEVLRGALIERITADHTAAEELQKN
jgi:hypothetical protein